MMLLLSGCSASFELGRARPPAIIPAAAGAAVIEPDGTEIVTPAPPQLSPIETVIIGLEQAQKVRTLTRQLAR
jgi:hypothetical protein